MKLLSAIIVMAGVMICRTALAEFKDYRAVSFEQTPEQFEASVNLDELYPNSAIIFTMGHRLLWEVSNVKDFIVQDGRLSAILAGNTVYLEDNLCNGLIVADDVDSIAYKNGYMLASSPESHHIYYVPDCAHYNSVPRYAASVDISDSYICEAAENEYIIRDLATATVSMRTSSALKLMATYGHGQACYFLEEYGLISVVDSATQHIAVTDAGEQVISAVTSEGINATTERGGFDFVVYDTGATTINFYEGTKAERHVETADASLVLQDGILSAYAKEESLQKILLTSFDPSTCKDAKIVRQEGDKHLLKCNVDEEIVYFVD